eukprot:CAMPEP_0178386182 /NCGR_PEP_ID=MMETSP0689_2-20121128/8428_1 /TAXON_ID=160604 /ORGANISM="Amphidinium massartii, Strain CS-259" /LENGTH=57 /DNA_ID=CAMNT_0020006511 /DNA_START=88 /DNA_END=261 /DNA_ORIENTATION=+
MPVKEEPQPAIFAEGADASVSFVPLGCRVGESLRQRPEPCGVVLVVVEVKEVAQDVP